MKAAVLYFNGINEREHRELGAQCARLEEFYGNIVSFLPPRPVGEPIPADVDAVVFPQLVGAAFSETEALKKIDLPVIVITSEFGTVEMWDWEIVTFLRDIGLNVFSPYNTGLAKCIFRAIACKKKMRDGVKFLMFQDDPGEGKQAGIFKRFYWWEEECTRRLEQTFGIKIIYKSYKAVCEKARAIDDVTAEAACVEWDIPVEGVSHSDYLKAVKFYLAVKEVIAEVGDVEGVGANCLNESFHSETTPCLAWNMLYENDNILWVCEGDTLTLISKFMFYQVMLEPIMMTNIYPFLMGMAALKHEKIEQFPDIKNGDNHALCVHCGYFGLAPRSFCTHWTLRPKVLEIVSDNAVMVDCRIAKGPVTLAKLHSDMKKVTLIECEITGYVQYPGSDCRNGALLHFANNNGHTIMDSLSSHHALLIQGNCLPELMQALRVFGFEIKRY